MLGGGPLAQLVAEDLSRARDVSITLADAVDASDPEAVRALVPQFNVVVSALPPHLGSAALRAVIEANRQIADTSTPVEQALALEDLAIEMEVAACVGCGCSGLQLLIGRSDAALEIAEASARGQPLDARVAALMATALARRLLTGDFRGHWGVWTPEHLATRVGMAHGILQDLRERGIDVRGEARYPRPSGPR